MKMRNKLIILFGILVFASIFITQLVSAANIYVDKNLSSDCIGSNYSIAGRNCSGSDGNAYNTIQKAANISTAGTIVLIRNGTYNEIIWPRNSGTAGNPITYKAFEGENVSIAGATLSNVPEGEDEDHNGDRIGIYIWDKDYIVIEGVTVPNITHQWARIVYSSHITLQKNKFIIYTGRGINFINSSYCRILNNTIYGGSDNLELVSSDRNLIEGNNFTRGRHTLWSLRGGSFNVIRNNYFYNEIQKIGEVYDNVRTDRPWLNFSNDPIIPLKFNGTHYNLIENNTFAYTAPDDGDGPYNGIQYAGQNGIIRKNLFYNTQGGGLGMALYGGEASYNLYNRVYNNVFYNNTGGAIGTGYQLVDWYFIDNIFKNNILYKGYQIPVGWQDDLLGSTMISHHSFVANFLFEINNIINSTAGETTAILIGYNQRINLSTAQTNYPSLYVNNTEVNPEFIDAENYNFKLNSSSSMIDNGTYLTRTVGVGSGTSMHVLDATYFYDGFDISGEVGDMIRLENGQAARITDIDYSTNTLILDRALSWTDGQGVSLNY
jgi:parallel beta-helix repeat protein